MNSTTERVRTEAELMSLPKEEGKQELVDGKLVVIPLYGLRHVEIIGRLAFKLHEVVQKHDLGHVLFRTVALSSIPLERYRTAS